ncbi:MAG: serine/threonine protein kinase [Planctomycetes bacterium]|nr:serine/threonine protein kinase [Planctomycetota bacterium]
MTDLLRNSNDVPERFGPFRRIRELGSGAMGAVLEVEHGHTGGRYALKVILPDALDAEALARFQREARAMARLNHPHVARIHAAQLDPPLRYLVLDLCTGGTLKDRLKAGPLPIEQAATIGAQLASGVAHAHARGILHRDIKPTNVLFDERGSPVLADFGLARSGDASRMTRTGELLGTPLYMAPEQVLDGKRAGPEADVYALGALLYLMLAGRPPIEAGTSLMETLDRVITEVPPPIRELRQDVPAELDLLLRRTLAKEPAERPNAAEFAAALTQLPISTAAPTTLPRRYGWAVALLLAAALGAAGLVWFPRGVGVEGGPSASEPDEVAGPPVAPARPAPWVESLHEAHVTLTLSDDQALLSLLARCTVRPSKAGTWVWTFEPERVSAWDGERLEHYLRPPSAGASASDQACAELLAAPLQLSFDESGVLTGCDTPARRADFGASALEALAARLADPDVLGLFSAMLEVTPTPAPLAAERVSIDAAGRLVGAVTVRNGWASLQPVPVARFLSLDPKDKSVSLELLPTRERALLHEGLLLAANGLDDPDGKTNTPARTWPPTLELPGDGADDRVLGVRPEFELVQATNPAQAHSRPWGSPLGTMARELPYVRLTRDVHGWTPIGWQGGEAWVRSAQLSAYKPSLVAVITAERGDPLNVRPGPAREPGEQLAEPRLGSLRNGQTIAVFGFPLDEQQSFLSVTAGGVVKVPPYSHWCQTTWGTGVAYVKASRIVGRGSHELFMFLLPSGLKSEAPWANGAAPELPHSESSSPR